VPIATSVNASKCAIRVGDHVSLLTRSVQPIMAVAKGDFINCPFSQRRLTNVIAREGCHLWQVAVIGGIGIKYEVLASDCLKCL
jgi:hypothetical protein